MGPWQVFHTSFGILVGIQLETERILDTNRFFGKTSQEIDRVRDVQVHHSSTQPSK